MRDMRDKRLPDQVPQFISARSTAHVKAALLHIGNAFVLIGAFLWEICAALAHFCYALARSNFPPNLLECPVQPPTHSPPHLFNNPPSQ